MESQERDRKEGGQSIILVAVAMVALVIFVAITVDMSNAYRYRRIAQNAADAAALGGAEEMGRQLNSKSPSGKSIAEDANDFAERNGIADTDGTLANAVNENVEVYYLDNKQNEIGLVKVGSVPKHAVGIRAYTYITAPTFFGGIAGFAGYPLSAKAAVYFEAACTGGWCMLPIAINDNGYLASIDPDVAEGQCFNMWDGAGTGNFGWVNWSLQEVSSGEEGGTGYGGDTYSCQDPALYDWYPGLPEELPDDCSASCLDINMNPDYCTRINPADIYVGADVGGTTGVKNGNQIRDRLEWYITQGTPVKVLIYDHTSGNIKTGQEDGCAKDDRPNGLKYNVAGFACFVMTGFRLSSGGGVIECDRYVGADGAVMLTCHDGPSSSLECDPALAIDYPGECRDAYGNECDFDDYETGEVNRITGRFVSCTGGAASNCKTIGNMLAPQLDE